MPACPSSTEYGFYTSRPPGQVSLNPWCWLLLKPDVSRVVFASLLKTESGKDAAPTGEVESALKQHDPAGILWHGTVFHERNNRRFWNHHTWLSYWFPVNVIETNSYEIRTHERGKETWASSLLHIQVLSEPMKPRLHWVLQSSCVLTCAPILLSSLPHNK